MNAKHGKYLRLIQFALLLSIEAIVCFTPLGSLPIGPLVATLMHVPVIITAVTLGLVPGALMGFFSGLFSFIVWSFMPPSPLLAFAFTPVYAPGNAWSVVICFVPRVLIGVLSYLAFTGLKRLVKNHKGIDFIAYIAGGISGSLANTVFVLLGIYVFFGAPYAAANGLAYEALLGAMGIVIGTNGVLELVIGAVCAYAVGKPIRKYLLRVE